MRDLEIPQGPKQESANDRRGVSVRYLYEVEDAELAFRSIDDKNEVERGVIPVHHSKLLTVVGVLAEKALEFWCVKEVA